MARTKAMLGSGAQLSDFLSASLLARIIPSEAVHAAYDDAPGVTAAFNKNMLFNVQESRIEMHLEAIANTTVRWPGHERSFAVGDRIHTENSCKYTLDSMTDMLKQAGFSQVRHWTDVQGWFGVFWASK